MKELDSQKAEEVKQPTLAEMVKDPEHQKQALLIANNMTNIFGTIWVNFKRFAKGMKGQGGKSVGTEQFTDIIQYLKAFDLAVAKNDRGDLKFKIDFNHEAELELIEGDIEAHHMQINLLEVRRDSLIEKQKEAPKDEAKEYLSSIGEDIVEIEK